MDTYLVNYLRSGRAWVLIGSGPSIQMGYPTWRELAQHAVDLCRVQSPGTYGQALRSIEGEDYPAAFEAVASTLGRPRLVEALRPTLKPRHTTSALYDIVAKWPVSVYLTTNFDDEISKHLVSLGLSYRTYSNSRDHMQLLLPDVDGAIVKLHGDLTSGDDLILTNSDYTAIQNAKRWSYWRQKMAAVAQMVPLIVIGHSLTDPNIQDVLKAAKSGSGINQPVCWIAPDVKPNDVRTFLEDFRIRVVAYDNRTGDHSALLQLLRQITMFVPPRASVAISRRVEEIITPAETDDTAAAFYVLNRLEAQPNIKQRREDVMLAMIQSALQGTKPGEVFDVGAGLARVGWPASIGIPSQITSSLAQKAIDKGWVRRADGGLRITAIPDVRAEHQRFEHLKERFVSSVSVRIRQFYDVTAEDAEGIARDINRALTGYFRRGGLSLATILFASEGRRARPVPPSILSFITQASAQYPDYLRRQIFAHVSVDAFVTATAGERQYLGRLAQSFFAFHSLGTFGDGAQERLQHVKETVWVIDSSAQIPALALGGPSFGAFRQVFEHLKTAAVRMFSTGKLFEETFDHLGWALEEVRRHGSDSPFILAAATGQPPYRRQNVFLQGFIEWRAVGNVGGFDQYMYDCLGHRKPIAADLEGALRALGIDVVYFEDWPGFDERDFAYRDECASRLKELMRRHSVSAPVFDARYEEWLDRKVTPEAEAFVVVKRERSGGYNVLGPDSGHSPAHFVSATSAINAIERGLLVTWQPEAFLAFAGTLVTNIDDQSSERAFEALLWNLAQAGVVLLREEEVEAVFGSYIDQTRIRLAEQHEVLEETLAAKYGESPEAVLARMPPSQRAMGALQLSAEALAIQRSALDVARANAREGARAREELETIGRDRRRIARKAAKRTQRDRRASTISTKRRKH